ncbi:hypothetical protein CYLTODRAFT_448368 [Cylindrobasidium torrendii FP15055 ss-10]|uniref:Uncharacterized protein n=1 Tax=Cylindrobasidium torrendii FP15055 ss-10 TaxID=1314674 RepID=A0A0D7BUJ5_9AGAR|nr:hypothetical protein CYLTODRAFT_448368 [Cylindrobasidium torrendii FP15055 ss-10]
MSLMLSGYIVPAPDLLAIVRACALTASDNVDALVPAMNAYLAGKDGVPLLRRIQPQGLILLPTRAITGMRFKFEQEDRDLDVKRAFLDTIPDPRICEKLDSQMKFVTVPNPFGCLSGSKARADTNPPSRHVQLARTSKKRDRSD